jgi:hypothetical protein
MHHFPAVRRPASLCCLMVTAVWLYLYSPFIIQPLAELRLHTAFAPIRWPAVFCVCFHIGIAPAYSVIIMPSHCDWKQRMQLCHTEHTMREPSPMNGTISIVSIGPHAAFLNLDLRPDPQRADIPLHDCLNWQTGNFRMIHIIRRSNLISWVGNEHRNCGSPPGIAGMLFASFKDLCFSYGFIISYKLSFVNRILWRIWEIFVKYFCLI